LGFVRTFDLLKVTVGDRGPLAIFLGSRTLKLGSLLQIHKNFIVHFDPDSKNKQFDSSSRELPFIQAEKKCK